MSRQREDATEVRPGLGPLFEPAANHLAGRTDPQTSRDAARLKLATLGKDQALALALVRAYPGNSAKGLAAAAMDNDHGIWGVDFEAVRQRIGRRLNELEKAGLIRRDGVRDGCSCWWPVEGK
jgi:hypothetical protein